jgi:hypothetical protein
LWCCTPGLLPCSLQRRIWWLQRRTAGLALYRLLFFLGAVLPGQIEAYPGHLIYICSTTSFICKYLASPPTGHGCSNPCFLVENDRLGWVPFRLLFSTIICATFVPSFTCPSLVEQVTWKWRWRNKRRERWLGYFFF